MKLFNSVSGKIENLEFKNNTAKIYLCGPTVYNDVHIGNIRPVIVFDILARYLVYQKINLDYISNITDIDDKIINKATQLNQKCDEIAKKYTNSYFDILKLYNIKYPKTFLKATDYIKDMENFINHLINKDFAYKKDGDVYFRVKKDLNYGLISNQNINNLKSNFRIENKIIKEDILDFTLWKKDNKEPSFKTNFSSGRPGWHTECATLNFIHFKDQIDIHGGGFDLKFPHHENENSQFKMLTGKDLARFWVHIAFINFENGKMSKSLGNLILAKEIENYASPFAFKLLVLAHNYHQPINFSFDLLTQYQNEYLKLDRLIKKMSFLFSLNSINENKIDDDLFSKIINYLANDLATEKVVTEIFQLEKIINKETNLINKKIYFNTLIKILAFMGFNFSQINYDSDIISLYQEWEKLKSLKDFENADKLRNELISKGVIL